MSVMTENNADSQPSVIDDDLPVMGRQSFDAGRQVEGVKRRRQIGVSS